MASPIVQAKTNSRPSSKDKLFSRILYLVQVGYSGNDSMSYPINVKSSVLQQLARLLFEPSPQITIASQRRRARLLSSLLIFAFAMVCITVVGERVYDAIFTLIILGAGYGFSRTRYYEWGALLAVFALMIPSFAMILTAAPNTLADVYLAASPLSWLILALLLASLWAKAWIAAVVTIITVGAILGLPVVRPEINTEAIRWMVALFGVSGGFLVLAAALRNRDSMDIETQTRALEDQHQRLQASEQRYRGLVENISDTVYATDINGYFTYMSPAGPTLTGYSLESLKGMHFLHLIDPEWRSVLMNFYQDQIANRKDETTLVFPLITAAGEQRWIEQKTALILDEKQALVGLQSFARDISENKKAEQQIHTQNVALVKANHELAVARKQAETASQLKSQFLATMSHELRTPLNAVIGYAQLQLAGMAGEMSEEQFEFQERILVNAQHLLQLINGVLDLAKIEAGRMELVEKPFDLRTCLNEIVIQNKVLAEEKGLEFTLTIDDGLPETIVGDQGRIKQVIINLVSNAIKFTDRGSVIVDVALQGDENWRVTVTDTGAGIASHLQETIFDEFRQAENGIDRGGTGLGLAIVRKLVLMMRGNIRLNSEVGRGSTFTVILPLVSEVQPISEPSEILEV